MAVAAGILSGLYVIVGGGPGDLMLVAAEAVAAGADIVQLRNKTAGAKAVKEQAISLREMTAAAGKTFIVNDSVELALEVGADGVHLGPDDMPVAEARRRAGDALIIGASAGYADTARAAAAAGADYIGAGPVFPTRTKADTRPVIGLNGLQAVCRAVAVPVFGIGGIDVERLPAVLEAGAAGAAMGSAISAAADVAATVSQIKQIISNRR